MSDIDAEPPATLDVRSVSKTFGDQRALADAHLQLRRGEVHALLGPNGSGKSTLIKILAGFYKPDNDSEALMGDLPFALGSADDARALGIRFVHQDLGLIPSLSVAENLALGGDFQGRKWLSDRRERRRATALFAEYGLHVDVSQPLESLSAAERTMVAIVRVTRGNSGDCALLVLDEVTATLPETEVQHLFGLIRELCTRGVTILYVTHRLQEVFDIADRVTVLRDGRNVATTLVEELDHDQLVELIVGAALADAAVSASSPSSRAVLQCVNLSGGVVVDASFVLHQGERLGVTGLVGSGYDELLGTIFGSRRRTGGEVTVDGLHVKPNSPRSALDRGIAYAPADRRGLGSLPGWSVRENITLPRLAHGPVWWLTEKVERRQVTPWLEQLDVRPPEPERTFSLLSGGNQQKAVLARWLRFDATVVILDEPTNGVDMGAKRVIYQKISDACLAGSSFILASSDPDELAANCDRVLIMRAGRIAAELTGNRLTADAIVSGTVRTTMTEIGSVLA